jgi:hypothetical protein
MGIRVVKTAELPEKQTYVFGIHPHSILPFGSMIAFNWGGKGG